MNELFGDASFFVALLHRRDEHHPRAIGLIQNLRQPIVTTDAVLHEVGNFLAAPPHRSGFVRWLREMEDARDFTILTTGGSLFDRGLTLYADREDKAWSLTDCTSFVVMDDRGIREALTNDHHFEQAGYVALMV